MFDCWWWWQIDGDVSHRLTSTSRTFKFSKLRNSLDLVLYTQLLKIEYWLMNNNRLKCTNWFQLCQCKHTMLPGGTPTVFSLRSLSLISASAGCSLVTGVCTAWPTTPVSLLPANIPPTLCPTESCTLPGCTPLALCVVLILLSARSWGPIFPLFVSWL